MTILFLNLNNDTAALIEFVQNKKEVKHLNCAKKTVQ